MNCLACEAKRCHTAEEWKNHPLAGHGFMDGKWSSPAAQRLHVEDVTAAQLRSVPKNAVPKFQGASPEAA